MAKGKQNNEFDTFAWLIYREVENYINEHSEEYELWAQKNTEKESTSEQQICESA